MESLLSGSCDGPRAFGRNVPPLTRSFTNWWESLQLPQVSVDAPGDRRNCSSPWRIPFLTSSSAVGRRARSPPRRSWIRQCIVRERRRRCRLNREARVWSLHAERREGTGGDEAEFLMGLVDPGRNRRGIGDAGTYACQLASKVGLLAS